MTTSPATRSSASCDATTRRLGLVVLGDAEVAVPIETLREVLPCPRHLAGLPVSAPGLLGALDLRDQALPVVDLLQRPEVELGGTRIVVVLSHGGRTIGLLADGIRGLVDVGADRTHAVSATGGALLASHTFIHPADRRVISVLDVERVLALDGVPVVHADASAGGDAAGRRTATASGDRRVLTVLRCGSHTIAIDVADVHTIIPSPEPQPSVLRGGSCLGATPFRDERVALVDPLVVLGVGAMPAGTPEAGMVLTFDDGLLVLAVSATVDIVSVEAADVMPVPAHAVARPDIVQGVLQLPSMPSVTALVLDPAALRADADLRTLASLHTPLDSAQWDQHAGRSGARSADAGPAGTEGDRAACLSYSIGFDLATPLSQVDEIIAMPDDVTEIERSGRTVGVALHRGVAIPMLSLAELLGRDMAVPATTQCVLVVDVDGERWGLVVDRLNEIAPRTWRADESDAGAGGALAGARLVTLGDSRRLIPEVDLRAVIRAAVRAQDVLDGVAELEELDNDQGALVGAS